MPLPQNDTLAAGVLSFRLGQLVRILPPRAAILSLGLALAFSSCKKNAPEASAQSRTSPAEPSASATRTAVRTEGYAVWYEVPVDSLAKRRAGQNELTAAHNRLPLGTMVRVTQLANGKHVIVRITDRGITDRHSVIDLCKEAAAELGMLSEGSARVRLEILPDDKSDSRAPDSKTSGTPP